MMKREELKDEWADCLANSETLVYVAEEADKVMDAMEAKIMELETKISMLETTQKWISVNDMLPPKHKEIIGCTVKGNVMPCWFTDYARAHLSHWMPLPPPPSPDKEN